MAEAPASGTAGGAHQQFLVMRCPVRKPNNKKKPALSERERKMPMVQAVTFLCPKKGAANDNAVTMRLIHKGTTISNSKIFVGNIAKA